RARELASGEITGARLRRSHFVAESELHTLGLAVSNTVIAGWAVDEQRWAELPGAAAEEFAAWTRDNPLAAGMPARTLCARLGLPRTLLGDLLRASELHSSGGLIRRTDEHALPPWVERAVRDIVGELRSEPFRAPEADRLAALGLGQRELAAAARAGWLLRLSDGVVLAPEALARARSLLAELGEPFTVSQARRALGTTRRVAVPLLERLDAEGITTRLTDTTRTLHPAPGPGAHDARRRMRVNGCDATTSVVCGRLPWGNAVARSSSGPCERGDVSSRKVVIPVAWHVQPLASGTWQVLTPSLTQACGIHADEQE